MTNLFEPNPVQANASYVDISAYNTMALACQAKQFIRLTDLSDIEPTFKQLAAHQQAFVVLSNGSNIILPEVLDAFVVSPTLKGKTILSEDSQTITLEVMAGEDWHTLVLDTVHQGWYGLENLALIPSWVGGSPVQNIGAYGVQAEDVIGSVKAFHIPSLTWHHLSKSDCQFSYRDSLFKQAVTVAKLAISVA